MFLEKSNAHVKMLTHLICSSEESIELVCRFFFLVHFGRFKSSHDEVDVSYRMRNFALAFSLRIVRTFDFFWFDECQVISEDDEVKWKCF